MVEYDKYELKYRSLFNKMTNGFIYCKLEFDEGGKANDYTFIEVNKAFEEMSGLTKGELINKKASKIFSRQCPFVETFSDIALNNNEVSSEKYFPEPFEKWFSIQAYSLEKGYFAVIFEDITSRKKDEAEKQKLLYALEQSPSVVTITNTEGNLEYVNPKFCEITGYSKDEVIGNNPRVLKSGTQDDQFYKELWETIAAGKIWRGDFSNKRKNGEIYWERASISSIKDEYDKITNYIKVAEDITERKEIEEKLRESEKNYKILFNNTNDALFVYQPSKFKNNFFIEVNNSACNMLGYKRDELLKLNPLAIEKEKDDVKFLMVINSLFEKKQLMYEKELKTKNNENIYTEINATMFDFKKRPTILFAVRDITKRKKAELKLKKTMDELKRSYEELNQFTSIVSHDLKSPLAVIISYLGIIMKKYISDTDKKGLEMTNTVARRARRMADMIDELLSYARLDTKSENFQNLPAEKVLNYALENIELEIKKSNAIITYDKLPIIYGGKASIVKCFSKLDFQCYKIL